MRQNVAMTRRDSVTRWVDLFGAAEVNMRRKAIEERRVL